MDSSNLSPVRVLSALPRTRARAVTVARLLDGLGLSTSARPRIETYLSEFVRAGLAARKGSAFWRVAAPGALIGTIRGTRSGHAFVVPDDAEERSRGDVFIGSRSLGPAMHGDAVIVRIVRVDDRGREGRVEGVLERGNPTVVGRFTHFAHSDVVSPIDERFFYEIQVAPLDRGAAAHGDVVTVEITRPPAAGRPPWGRILEVLGREDSPGIDIEIVIRKHGLPHVFPATVLKEADAFAADVTSADLAGRLDLREQLTITIDGETARDFDDAVSIAAGANGRYLLGVHIADVSHYVREGSALDEEAFRRGTSVYFPERAIPMLPERLSNGICSLKPGEDRLTMSALMELDGRGRVVDYRLTPSVIHSRNRMTYTSVNEILANPQGETARAHSHLCPMLQTMEELTRILIRRREERGAIDFDLPEAELEFNDEGQICGIVRSERNFAHRLIEEFMLLANETVARHLEALRVPAVYRIHEEPNPSKVEEFAEIAESFGHHFHMPAATPQRGFQHLSREVRGTPEEQMLSYLMLRSMQRARYSQQNAGHFGLAMPTYTHFTSPIRRYPDLIVHRTLRALIEEGSGGEDDWRRVDLGSRQALEVVDWAVFDEERESSIRGPLESICERSSERERAADDAERELMDWRKARFMATRIGEEFEGRIVSVQDYGFYVELLDYFVDGLVHFTTLIDDEYEFHERRHRLVGRRTGRTFRLGDAARVRVDRVDLTRHRVEFSLA